jgi:hypothetical protein
LSYSLAMTGWNALHQVQFSAALLLSIPLAFILSIFSSASATPNRAPRIMGLSYYVLGGYRRLSLAHEAVAPSHLTFWTPSIFSLSKEKRPLSIIISLWLIRQTTLSLSMWFVCSMHERMPLFSSFTQDRYEQFQTAIRIWRHMKLVKRAGRGHDPAGIDSTSPGECAVECPACPHPDRNLPDDWKDAPESIGYVPSRKHQK